MLVQLMGAKKCLEVGTFTGYSAAWVACALPPDGKHHLLRGQRDLRRDCPQALGRGRAAGKIDLRMGPALDTLAALSRGRRGTFDYAFIDADKANYDVYYERCLELSAPAALIAIDNTLWDGKVADPAVTDADTVAIRALNAKLFGDERVSLSFLPFADGLTLARKN